MKLTLGGEAFLAGLKADPELSVWQWSDQHRVLLSKSSAEAGQWRTARIPYAYKVMEALSVGDVCTEVIAMKGAQLGFTEIGNCWLCYLISCVPAPVLMVLPDIEMAKRTSKMRIQPMIDASPAVAIKMADAKSRDSSNTLLSKDFEGGFLAISGANSPAGLASMPVRNLFMDEIDRFKRSAGGAGTGEGSPIKLAEARTRTFETKKKIFKVSTPTVDGNSPIQREYERSSKEQYFVPCPHCSEMQILEWSQMRYEAEDIVNTIHYECIACRGQMYEHHKTEMLAGGDWRAQVPEEIYVRGFHISSLYSPVGWYSWARAALEYEEARGDVEQMKVWTNTVLGLTFRETGEMPDYQRLYERREDYLPGRLVYGSVLLTAGIDVQKDRLELALVAWNENKEKWLVDYKVFVGDVEQDGCWDEAEEYLNSDFPIEGSELTTKISAFACDSGFANLRVSQFIKRFRRNKAFMIKGVSEGAVFVGNARAGEVRVNGQKVKTGLKVWNITVDIAKTELYRQLTLPMPETGKEAPKGYFHFHRDCSLDWFRGLCSEEIRSSKVKGFEKFYFEKVYRRNEPLDTVVYARAALAIMGGDRWKPSKWQQMREDLGIDVTTLIEQRDEEEREVTEMAVTPLIEDEQFSQPKASVDVAPKKPARRKSNYW